MQYLFLLLAPIGISFFILFDLIVRLEYKFHVEDWEKDQRPVGFLWRPRGAGVWSGSIARSRLASSWVFNTPVWMLDDQRARRLLFWYRCLWWMFMLGWATGVVYVIVREYNE
jgi:hypothetical protein